jgi:transposase
VHFLAILDYGRLCDLASEMDGRTGKTKAATVGCVLLPRFSAGIDGVRRFRRSESARDRAQAALKKTACGCCGRVQMGCYDRKVRRVRDLSCGDTRIYLEVEVRRLGCRRCGKVKRERLDFVADNPLYTKRFACYVGRRCRSATIKYVAGEPKLNRHTVEPLDRQSMEARRKRAGTPCSSAGDGGAGAQGSILFDKFHVMRHLGEALDQVGKSEYRRLAGRDRRYIKGRKHALLSRKENLTLDGKKALKTLLAANRRLNTAYVLKESFGRLWSCEREGWARRFFENGRPSLKWRRLKPYEKFAEMIDRHWDGIAAYCRPENKVSLGFVEGLNNEIRAIQRRARGLRDEECLRLKILACMLP